MGHRPCRICRQHQAHYRTRLCKGCFRTLTLAGVALPSQLDWPAGRPACRHCGAFRQSRALGLCFRCSRDPAVRLLYPSIHRGARRGIPDRCGGYRLPAEPTAALPGTPEKLAELERRALAGISLWHPEDARASCA